MQKKILKSCRETIAIVGSRPFGMHTDEARAPESKPLRSYQDCEDGRAFHHTRGGYSQRSRDGERSGLFLSLIIFRLRLDAVLCSVNIRSLSVKTTRAGHGDISREDITSAFDSISSPLLSSPQSRTIFLLQSAPLGSTPLLVMFPFRFSFTCRLPARG